MATTTAVRDRKALLAALPLARLELQRKRAVAQREAEERAASPPVFRIGQPVDAWIDQHFYQAEADGIIHLAPFQRAVLRYATQRRADGTLRWRTVIWSQPKKSGKTAISGAVGRWVAETWGPYQLVLFVGNDAGQAKERGFAALCESVELTEGFDRRPAYRMLPDKWRLRETEAHAVNGSMVKAIAADYRGEAGANPSLTVYTELWGFDHTAAKRFWAEMAPSPTRQNSMRWIETYAGYEGESELLWGLYEGTVKNGRQLTVRDLREMFAAEEWAKYTADGPLFAEAPGDDDLVPCYVDEAAGIFAFWDSGEQARRMPWQQGERGAAYYANEAATQTANQYRRLHLNEWVSAESAFIPIEWWQACYNPTVPLKPGDKTPLVIALDAAEGGETHNADCFGMVVVSRDPDNVGNGIAVRGAQAWVPPPGDYLSFDGPEEAVRWWCTNYNVVEVAYDPHALGNWVKHLREDGVANFQPFGQGAPRLGADHALYQRIRDRSVRHNGEPDLTDHLANANAKLDKDQGNRLRIVKKSDSRKIDLAVCLSMASAECFRLFLS